MYASIQYARREISIPISNVMFPLFKTMEVGCMTQEFGRGSDTHPKEIVKTMSSALMTPVGISGAAYGIG
jgi:hypothetical protein